MVLEVYSCVYRLCKLLHMYFGLRELCRGHFVSDQSLGEDFSLDVEEGSERISLRRLTHGH